MLLSLGLKKKSQTLEINPMVDAIDVEDETPLLWVIRDDLARVAAVAVVPAADWLPRTAC